MTPGTPQQVLDFVPNRKLNTDSTAPESSADSIQLQLDELYNKQFLNSRRKYSLPISDTPLTHKWLLVQGLSVLPIAGGFIRTITPTSDQPQIVRYGSALIKLSADRLQEYQDGGFRHGMTKDFPIDPLCTVDDCLVNTPGLSAADYPQFVPVWERWILWEGAIVRSKAAFRNYKQSDLTTEQADTYRPLVALTVRGFILAALGFINGYSAEIDAEVAHLIAKGRKAQEDILSNQYPKLSSRT